MTEIIIRDSSYGKGFSTKEGFERPNHPDFMDNTELRKIKFTGVRHNQLTNDCELWIVGYVVETVTEAQVALNPMAINEAYERVFAIEKVMPDTDEARRFMAIKGRME